MRKQHGLPFVVYIDALNESPRGARWKNKLPELLAQCAPYPGLKVCVSTRDTYRDLVVDARFPGYAFEHSGFAGREFEAVEAFATHYGLDAEITPLFSPELGNPLFLHLACRTLRDEGLTSLDVSLPGFAALLDSHLKHCDGLVRGRLAYTNPKNLVRAAMLRLSEVLTCNLPKERTWEACTAELSEVVGTEVPAEALLKELEHEGLVILSAGDHDTWFVRLGYQRYGDILRASGIVERLTGPQGLTPRPWRPISPRSPQTMRVSLKPWRQYCQSKPVSKSPRHLSGSNQHSRTGYWFVPWSGAPGTASPTTLMTTCTARCALRAYGARFTTCSSV
ncbi:hypothetical protein [Candidatus Aalborgicola defluviihabitans]|uniref:hypothetical protein n=1 Tax=Candidatus Aalborgicola defluviihabitans TaxID=3386187 RepID=UPI001D83F898|nr:hypothetical protein [Burkholderiales bacterium]